MHSVHSYIIITTLYMSNIAQQVYIIADQFSVSFLLTHTHTFISQTYSVIWMR